jgi:hypothetical protein
VRDADVDVVERRAPQLLHPLVRKRLGRAQFDANRRAGGGRQVARDRRGDVLRRRNVDCANDPR